MAIDKAVNKAPMGIMSDTMMEEGEPIEIEIEDPESVAIKAGGVEVILSPEPEGPDDFDANLAEFMDDDELSSLATDLLSDFQSDVDSRKDWIQTYVDGIQLLGMKLVDRTEPWPGACGVTTHCCQKRW